MRSRLLRGAVWVVVMLALLNRDSWDYSVWDAPQTEWFQHALQWDADWDACMCDLTKEET